MENNVLDEILEEMINNGSFYKAQSAGIANTGKEVVNSNIDEAKTYRKPKDNLANELANEMVFQFLEQHKLDNTIDCAKSESFGNFIRKHDNKWAGKNLQLNGSKSLVKQLCEEHEIPDTTISTTIFPEITDIIQQILIPSKRLPRPPSESDDEYDGEDQTLETTITNFDLNPHQKRALEERFLREAYQLELKRKKREQRALDKEKRRQEHEARKLQRELARQQQPSESPTLTITEDSISDESPELVDAEVMAVRERKEKPPRELNSDEPKSRPKTIYIEEEEEVYEEEDIIDEYLRTDSINSSELIMTNASSSLFSEEGRKNRKNKSRNASGKPSENDKSITPQLTSILGTSRYTSTTGDNNQTEGSAYPGSSSSNTVSNTTNTHTRSSATKGSSSNTSSGNSKQVTDVPTLDSTYPGNVSTSQSDNSVDTSSMGSDDTSNAPSQYPGSVMSRSTPGLSRTRGTTTTKVRSSATNGTTTTDKSRPSILQSSITKDPTLDSTYPGSGLTNGTSTGEGMLESGYPGDSVTKQTGSNDTYSHTSNYSMNTSGEGSEGKQSELYSTGAIIQTHVTASSTYTSDGSGTSTSGYSMGTSTSTGEYSTGGGATPLDSQMQPLTAGDLGSFQQTSTTNPDNLDNALLPGVADAIKMREARSQYSTTSTGTYSTGNGTDGTDFTYQTVSVDSKGEIPTAIRNQIVTTVTDIDTGYSTGDKSMHPLQSLSAPSSTFGQGMSTYATTTSTKLQDAFLSKAATDKNESSESIDTNEENDTSDLTYETITVDQNGKIVTSLSSGTYSNVDSFEQQARSGRFSQPDDEETTYTYDTITVDEQGRPVDASKGTESVAPPVTPMINDYTGSSIRRDDEGRFIGVGGVPLQPAEAATLTVDSSDAYTEQTGTQRTSEMTTDTTMPDLAPVEASKFADLKKQQKLSEKKGKPGKLADLYAQGTGSQAGTTIESTADSASSDSDDETYITVSVDENGMPVSQFAKALSEVAASQKEQIEQQQQGLLNEAVPDWAKSATKTYSYGSGESYTTGDTFESYTQSELPQPGSSKFAQHNSELSSGEYTYESVEFDPNTGKPLISDQKLREEVERYAHEQDGKLRPPSTKTLNELGSSTDIDGSDSEEYTYMSVSEDQIPFIQQQISPMAKQPGDGTKTTIDTRETTTDTKLSVPPPLKSKEREILNQQQEDLSRFKAGVKHTVDSQDLESMTSQPTESTYSYTSTTATPSQATAQSKATSQFSKRTRRHDSTIDTKTSTGSRLPSEKSLGRPLTALEKAFAAPVKDMESGEYSTTESGDYTSVSVTVTVDSEGNPVIPQAMRDNIEREQQRQQEEKRTFQREYPTRPQPKPQEEPESSEYSTDEPVSEWSAMTRPIKQKSDRKRGSREALLSQITGASTETGSGVKVFNERRRRRDWDAMVNAGDAPTTDESSTYDVEDVKTQDGTYTYVTVSGTAGQMLLDKVRKETATEQPTQSRFANAFTRPSNARDTMDSNIDSETLDSYITHDTRDEEPKKPTRSLAAAVLGKPPEQKETTEYTTKSVTIDEETRQRLLNLHDKQAELDSESIDDSYESSREPSLSPEEVEKLQRYKVPSNKSRLPQLPKKYSEWDQMMQNQSEAENSQSGEFSTETPTSEMTEFEKMLRHKNNQDPLKFSVPQNNFRQQEEQQEQRKNVSTDDLESDSLADTYTYKTVTLSPEEAKALQLPVRSKNNEPSDDEELNTWERMKRQGDREANENSEAEDVYNPNAKNNAPSNGPIRDSFKKMMADGNVDKPATSVTNPTRASIDRYMREREEEQRQFQQRLNARRQKQERNSTQIDTEFTSDTELQKPGQQQDQRMLAALKRQKVSDAEEPSLDLSMNDQLSSEHDSEYVDDVVVGLNPSGVMVRTTPDGREAYHESQQKLPRYTEADLGDKHQPTRHGVYGKQLPSELYAPAWEKMNANKIDSEPFWDGPTDEKPKVDRRLAPPKKAEEDYTYTYDTVTADSDTLKRLGVPSKTPKKEEDTADYTYKSVTVEDTTQERLGIKQSPPKKNVEKLPAPSFTSPNGSAANLNDQIETSESFTAPFEELEVGKQPDAFLPKPKPAETSKPAENKKPPSTKSKALLNAFTGKVAPESTQTASYYSESSTLESEDSQYDSADIGFAPPRNNPYRPKSKNITDAEFISDSIYRDSNNGSESEAESKSKNNAPAEAPREESQSNIPSRFIQGKKIPQYEQRINQQIREKRERLGLVPPANRFEQPASTTQESEKKRTRIQRGNKLEKEFNKPQENTDTYSYTYSTMPDESPKKPQETHNQKAREKMQLKRDQIFLPREVPVKPLSYNAPFGVTPQLDEYGEYIPKEFIPQNAYESENTHPSRFQGTNNAPKPAAQKYGDDFSESIDTNTMDNNEQPKRSTRAGQRRRVTGDDSNTEDVQRRTNVTNPYDPRTKRDDERELRAEKQQFDQEHSTKPLPTRTGVSNPYDRREVNNDRPQFTQKTRTRQRGGTAGAGAGAQDNLSSFRYTGPQPNKIYKRTEPYTYKFDSNDESGEYNTESGTYEGIDSATVQNTRPFGYQRPKQQPVQRNQQSPLLRNFLQERPLTTYSTYDYSSEPEIKPVHVPRDLKRIDPNFKPAPALHLKPSEYVNPFETDSSAIDSAPSTIFADENEGEKKEQEQPLPQQKPQPQEQQPRKMSEMQQADQLSSDYFNSDSSAQSNRSNRRTRTRANNTQKLSKPQESESEPQKRGSAEVMRIQPLRKPIDESSDFAEKLFREKPPLRRTRRDKTTSSGEFSDIPPRSELFPEIPQPEQSKFAQAPKVSGSSTVIDTATTLSSQKTQSQTMSQTQSQSQTMSQTQSDSGNAEEEYMYSATNPTTNTYTYTYETEEAKPSRLMPTRLAPKKSSDEPEYLYHIPAQPPLDWEPPRGPVSKFAATGPIGSTIDTPSSTSTYGSTLVMTLRSNTPLPEDPLEPIPYKPLK